MIAYIHTKIYINTYKTWTDLKLLNIKSVTKGIKVLCQPEAFVHACVLGTRRCSVNVNLVGRCAENLLRLTKSAIPIGIIRNIFEMEISQMKLDTWKQL